MSDGYRPLATQASKQVVAVGVSSLHPDERQDGGEGVARHIFTADLDSPRPSAEPAAFKACLQAAMHEFSVRVAYVMRTLKGHHVVSCDLATRRETERFEERLRDFGTDSVHGWASYRNGHAVLRVSPKPGEPRGPVFLRAVLARSPRPLIEREWSSVHYHFLNELHGGKLPQPGPVRLAAKATGGVFLERYTTKASAPKEAAPIVAGLQEGRTPRAVGIAKFAAAIASEGSATTPQATLGGNLDGAQ